MAQNLNTPSYKDLVVRKLSAPFQILLDKERPWRREFLTARAAVKLLPPASKLHARIKSQMLQNMSEYWNFVQPCLQYIRARYGRKAAIEMASALENIADLSARHWVELATFYYGTSLVADGDAAVTTAKLVDSRCLEAYALEAKNQRARGNLHQESQAVEQCIRLSRTSSERKDWQLWFGDTLVRQHQFEEAWNYLSSYQTLEPGDRRAYTAAYCGIRLGKTSDAEKAYAIASPVSGAERFDRLEAAKAQLDQRREDEVLRLIPGSEARVPSKLLEVRYQALLRLGRTEESLNALNAAYVQGGCSEWVPQALASLLQLTGETERAFEVLENINQEDHTPLSRFNAAYLAGTGQHDHAAKVLKFLELSHSKSISKAKSDSDIDPALPALIRAYEKRSSTHKRSDLEQILSRASSRDLIESAGQELAANFALAGEYDRAWSTILHSQYELLPAVSVTTRSSEMFVQDNSMYFAEASELLPIDPDVIVYESFHGATTSCNPYAICKELLSDPRYKHLRHVWVVRPNAHIQEELLRRPNVFIVKKGSPAHVRYLATAKYLINNSTFEPFFTRRQGQRYLNTWHGVPWKMLGRDSKSEPYAYGNIARNLLQATHILVPDSHTEDVLTRGMDIDSLLDAKRIRTGYPRNSLSVTLPEAEKVSIRKALGIHEDDKKLVLFMPTWKGLIEETDAEVQKVLTDAKSMTGPDRVIAVRAHHFVRAAFDDLKKSAASGIVFVPEHLETNKLLSAADALVTDFSSVLFDAASVSVPVVKLLDELDRYAEERGVYFNEAQVPGKNAYNADELSSLLQEALEDPIAFCSEYESATSRFGGVEDGKSGTRVIESFLDNTDKYSYAPSEVKRHSLFLSVGGLKPNGITRALRSLVVNLADDELDTYLFTSSSALQHASEETIADLRNNTRMLLSVGGRAGTRMERQLHRFFMTRRYQRSELFDRLLQSGRQREGKRLFGEASFGSVVDFDGYDALRTGLVAYGVNTPGKRGIILHNELWKEIENRFPRVQSGMKLISDLDFAGSVSDGVRDINSQEFFEHFGVPQEKHITVENTINASEILAHSQEPLEADDLAWYKDERAHAVVVARLSPEKNHLALLEAFAKVRGQLSKTVALTFLGDGPLRVELEQTIRSLDLEDVVRLRGLVSNPHAHLRAADVMLLPSRHEGQPLVILEALTVGTPVVATAIPGSKSVLQDGKLGTLVELSAAGLEEALTRVADGNYLDANVFDAEEFTRNSKQMFFNALK